MAKNKNTGLDKALPAEANLPPHDVAVRPAAGLPMVNSDTRGFEEGVDQTDLIIPRVKLMQPLSPELKEYKELRPGMIINSLTKDVLPATFVPIFYFKEWLRFNPRDKDKPGYDSTFAPGALMWRTRDAQDERVKQADFGPNGELPLAITTLNFFSVFTDTGMPVILSFSKTGYKAGKNLLSLAKLRGGAMFSRQYKLTVKEESNDKGDYYVMVVSPAGDCDPDTLKMGESYFQQFGMRRQEVKIHTEDEVPF